MEKVIAILIAYGAGLLMGWVSAKAENKEDCPRVMLGYNCKGSKTCDHSIREIKAALEVIGANRRQQ